MPNAKNFISIEDLSKEEILALLESAKRLKCSPPAPILKGKILASCFFEPSTRTRLSFEAAMLRLGGSVLGFQEGMTTSAAKGESLEDTMRVIGSYADIIVLRHPEIGAAQRARLATTTPIINAGDGSNEHPTQSLIDLFAMQQTQPRLESLNVGFLGDLEHARTIHSLAKACALFDMRLHCIGQCVPPGLSLSRISLHASLEEIIEGIDILYVTRWQQERDLTREKPAYLELSLEKLLRAKKTMKILHPLPRLGELPTPLDDTPHAHYFAQAADGVYVRQAILCSAAGLRFTQEKG